MPSVTSDDDLLVVASFGFVENVYRTVSRDIRFLDSRGSGVLRPSSHGRDASESSGVGGDDAGGGDDDAVTAAKIANTANKNTSNVEGNNVLAFMVALKRGTYRRFLYPGKATG